MTNCFLLRSPCVSCHDATYYLELETNHPSSCFLPGVLASFVSTWYKLKACWKTEPQCRIYPSRFSWGQTFVHFLYLWLMWPDQVHCEQGYTFPSDIGCCKKAGWTYHEEQTSKQQSSMASSFVPSSRFLPEFLSCLADITNYNLQVK